MARNHAVVETPDTEDQPLLRTFNAIGRSLNLSCPAYFELLSQKIPNKLMSWLGILMMKGKNWNGLY
jgi:hypothetical protein